MTGKDPRSLRLLEAILFASAEPLSERTLAGRLPDGADVAALLAELQGEYAGRGVNVVRAGKTWAMRTAPDLGHHLGVERVVTRKLSRAAIETLATIAYHQPVTRAEVEEIRGVSMSRGTLDLLLEAGWIRPRGRRRTPGRPMTWGTTDGFLDHFGLEDLGDLPGMDELKSAGLLESGPAIDAYRKSMKRDDTAEAGDADAPEDGNADAEVDVEVDAEADEIALGTETPDPGDERSALGH